MKPNCFALVLGVSNAKEENLSISKSVWQTPEREMCGLVNIDGSVAPDGNEGYR